MIEVGSLVTCRAFGTRLWVVKNTADDSGQGRGRQRPAFDTSENFALTQRRQLDPLARGNWPVDKSALVMEEMH